MQEEHTEDRRHAIFSQPNWAARETEGNTLQLITSNNESRLSRDNLAQTVTLKQSGWTWGLTHGSQITIQPTSVD